MRGWRVGEEGLKRQSADYARVNRKVITPQAAVSLESLLPATWKDSFGGGGTLKSFSLAGTTSC